MQISRHWRLNPVRYRLEGVRYEGGETSLQNRPNGPLNQENSKGKESTESTNVLGARDKQDHSESNIAAD